MLIMVRIIKVTCVFGCYAVVFIGTGELPAGITAVPAAALFTLALVRITVFPVGRSQISRRIKLEAVSPRIAHGTLVRTAGTTLRACRIIRVVRVNRVIRVIREERKHGLFFISGITVPLDIILETRLFIENRFWTKYLSGVLFVNSIK